MKKKILSILLCLCMVAVLLPTTALADETPGSYGYAYDVSRDNAYPSVGDNITLSRLQVPKNSDGDDYGKSEGKWTLTKVGSYSDMESVDNPNSNDLDGIVGNVAKEYKISDKKDTIVIHELKEDGNHIAYGVIIATDQEDSYVLFLGDSWSSFLGGAGYLLSKKAITDATVTVTAEMIATDFVEQHTSIALVPAEDYTFPAATEGYDTVPTLGITVKNTGSVNTGLLNITLSGNNANCFTVTPGAIDNIGTDSNNGASFQVEPKTGLAAGTYTATVTVDGTKVDRQSIGVSFTVNSASQSTPVVIIVPDDTTNTTDSTKNPETGDNSTHLLWAVMAFSALCAAALLFSSRKRSEEMQ